MKTSRRARRNPRVVSSRRLDAAVGDGEEVYAFAPVRFLVSPSYEQVRSLADSFFGPAAFAGFGLSFELYAAAYGPRQEQGRLAGGVLAAAAPAGLQNSPDAYRASTDFSAAQGYRNWYYLDSSGAQMSYSTAFNAWQGAETYNLLWAEGGHPGANADAVRQWRAPVGGTVRITGGASDANAIGGNGVAVTISKGGQALWQRTVENGDAAGFSFDLVTDVTAGEHLDLVINSRGGDNGSDSTNFDPTISYTGGGNQPPVANPGGPYGALAGQNTAFDGSGSYDPDGNVLSYAWDFGDGSTGSGVTPTHAYASPGTYAVTLTVTDNLGARQSAATTAGVSSSSSDQFVTSFLQRGLARQPSGAEAS